MSAVATIIDLFEKHGSSEYGGEAVTQLQHALQAARLAELEGAPATLITAALLHDIGHLLHDLPADAPDQGIDDHHENAGDHFLARYFSAAVTEPVRLHVAAKRYLCSTVSSYHAQLSTPSQVSLSLQGGLMSADEISGFEQLKYAHSAVRLRHWDDAGKSPTQETPPLAHFIPYLEAALAGGNF